MYAANKTQKKFTAATTTTTKKKQLGIREYYLKHKNRSDSIQCISHEVKKNDFERFLGIKWL